MPHFKVRKCFLTLLICIALVCGALASAQAGEPATFAFTAASLTATADKETVEAGTAVDEGGAGRIVTFGTVTKRWAEDKGVTSVEAAKNLGGGLQFSIQGQAEVSLTISSTGGSNESAFAIVSARDGSVTDNHEKVSTVTGTGRQTFTYTLGAGDWQVVSPQSDFNRGVRVYAVTVVDMVEKEAEAMESPVWAFRYFGVSTGDDRNVLLSAGKGIEASVSLGSALFNKDGSVSKKGGKFVADSPADGGSYYYTVIDPTNTNFYLQADVTVDALNPTPDGQEGFALMARDALGEEGVSGSWMANLVSVGSTKLPYGGVNKSPESACALGIRAYTGITRPEASEENDIQATRFAWWTRDGAAEKIEAGKTYRISLEKTDSAYITTQYDMETGAVIGSYTYYIPAKDHNALTVKNYDELDDPLTWQEGHAAYIALVVARGLNATFSNVKMTTSDWNPAGWAPQPTEYTDLDAAIVSAATTAGDSYGLILRTNADGTANVYMNGALAAENVQVTADAYCSLSLDMAEDAAEIRVDFTPDPDFAFSVFQKLSSYDPVSLSKTVTRRTLGKDGVICVKADGTSENDGTSMEDAVDIQTALDYAAPGQTILLAGETYDLSGAQLTVYRGRSGTAESPITLTARDGKFATLDFGGTGRGFKVWGDYWNISRINVTRTQDGLPGMQLAGHFCLLERMNFYNNGNTGLQVSGRSADDKSLWPASNLIRNCTSMNNADQALENADGIAAKLTTGDGNVFDGCISAYNADDGWDLFAKIATGPIGAVTIRNCLTYMNGYLRVREGSTAKSFVLAEISCDENGTLTFGDSMVMEAGNGDGFKMGGSNLPGGHVLINSIAYENKANGIDSNSCPDIQVYNCTAFNNGSNNIALYTGNTSAVTAFIARGLISCRSDEGVGEKLDLQNQPGGDAVNPTCYYWDPEKGLSVNTQGTAVNADCFISLDTSAAPGRNADGSIDMHGLLLLTEDARSEYAAGARGIAWGQREATVWVVGDSAVSAFNDQYFLPREGYGEEIASYFNANVYNLACAGASSKDYTGMEQYQTLMNGSTLIPALGDAGTDNFLIIGFGHNDEKTDPARFTDPTGDYTTPGSFANSLYVNYILPALERGVTPVVCTPIVRLTADNTIESYAGASGHVTADVTIGDTAFPGGSYAQAILDMVRALQAEGVTVEYIDLTEATMLENIAMDKEARWLHSFTGAKYAEDGKTLIATGPDQTHTNRYGAKLNAWLISLLAKETAPKLYEYSLNKARPDYDTFYPASVNPDYVVPDYQAPTDEQMNASIWPAFTDQDGNVWRGTVFGDVGGDKKITPDNFTAIPENGSITLGAANNCGKIASGSDGLMFYYTKLPAGTPFVLTAKATIQSFEANNQVSFGLMARDDLYIDRYINATMGDYVAAGSRNQGEIVNFGRQSGRLIGSAPANAVSLSEGTETVLKLAGTGDGFTLTYGGETVSAGFDYPLTAMDADSIYVGFYVVRNASVTFSDIHLTVE